MNRFKGFPNENMWRDHSSPKKVKNTEISKGDKMYILYKKREERKIMNNEKTAEQEIHLLGGKKGNIITVG